VGGNDVGAVGDWGVVTAVGDTDDAVSVLVGVAVGAADGSNVNPVGGAVASASVGGICVSITSAVGVLVVEVTDPCEGVGDCVATVVIVVVVVPVAVVVVMVVIVTEKCSLVGRNVGVVVGALVG
jgi:hypothetical protein